MAESNVNGNQSIAEAFANAAQRKSFFFEPPSRLQLVDKLEHLNRFSDFLLLVVGPKGAGKTTLLQRLVESESDRTLRACHLDAAVCNDLSTFLKQLSLQLSPQIDVAEDNQQVLNGIYEYVQVMAAEHIQWVIIIDNAEQLDAASLKLLLQMQSDAQGLPLRPHLLLAGTDLLLHKLQQADEYSLLEAQVHQLTLEPFAETEAKDYLLQRYSAAESITDKQFQAVYTASEGYPGGLNAQAEQLFRSGSISKPKTSKGLPKNMLAMVASVLLVILAGALWQFWPDSVDQASDRTQVQLQVPIEQDVVVPAAVDKPVTDIALNQPATFTPGQDNKPVRKPVAEQQGASLKQDIVEVAKPQPESIPVIEKEEPQVKPVTTPVIAQQTKEEPKAPEVSAQPAKPDVREPPVVADTKLTKAEQALLSWPETSYTLQVLGAGVRTSAEKFISSQAEPQKFYLFSTIYKSKPWFVVVYGQYKDRTTASSASKNLPPELAKLKPWARSVQGIQADLATRK